MRTLIISIVSLAVVWAAALVLLAIFGRHTAARDVAKLLPNLVMLFRGLRKDPRISGFDKALVVVALVWIASPVDLIPEFIPVLGPLDDALVAAFVLRRLVRAAGPEAVRQHWRGSDESLRLILRLAGSRPG